MEIWFKQKTRTRMKKEWIGRITDPKNRNSKNQSETCRM